ncbi:hypothetical protein QEG73_17630 [Chitinophagaceae bacterium 26-R-25]|nr:hypothetical protein [Chitinophagaceae bacterium 26-R-25]
MKLIIMVAAMFGALATSAQTAADFTLVPAAAITLSPGQKITMAIEWVDGNGKMHTELNDPNPLWRINGHEVRDLQSDDGNFTFKSLEMRSGVYTAPVAAPKKNPVMVTVEFHPSNVPGETAIVILQCVVTIADAYKVEGDIDMNASLTGMDIRMHIEDHVRYTVLNNGTAMLEPVNGRGTLHVKIVNGIMVQKDGALGKYTAPMEYDIPVLISIDDPGGDRSSSATVYVTTFSSPTNDETYEISSGSAATPFKENFINSVLKVIFMKDAGTAAHENQQNARDNMAWAERMQALRNKPQSEWTEQDKKDYAQMQALKQKLGSSTNSQNPFSNIPIDDKGSTVGNNNGKLTTYGAQNTKHQVPASAMGDGMGTMNFHCTFNPQASTVLELSKEDSDMAGVQHAKIHLVVKKEK